MPHFWIKGDEENPSPTSPANMGMEENQLF